MLRKMVESKEVSPEALQALVNLVDPFPDDSFVTCGWPDSRSQPTVRNKVEFEIPVSYAGAGSWDLHACILPFFGAALQPSGNFVWDIAAGGNSVVAGPTAGANPLSFLNLVTVASGSSMPVTATQLISNPAMNAFMTSIAGRIWRPCAMGLELINTSTDLYRGGMAYAYRVPSDLTSGTMQVSTAGNYIGGTSIIANPPKVPADIIGYANTYSGDARAGVGVVCTPCDFANPPVRPLPSMNFIVDPTVPSYGAYVGNGYPCPAVPWDISGAFVTGLAQQATFTLRFRMAYEIFPLVTDQLFFTLAQPSVAWSPVLEEAVLAVLKSMPAGFDYRDNPLGEWFAKVLNGIAEHLPKLQPVLASIHPVAGMAAGAASMIAREIANRTVKKERKQLNRDIQQEVKTELAQRAATSSKRK